MKLTVLNRPLLLVSLLLSATGAAALAAPTEELPARDQNGLRATLDPKAAGPDLQVQGEYRGRAGGSRLGAQVIALGNGRFTAVFLPGGLPGQGWDGKTRYRIEGRTDGSVTRFGVGVPAPMDAAAGWTGEIHGDTFRGRTAQGQRFSLKRVVRVSPDAGEKPPAGAEVLFNGTNTDAWEGGRMTPDHLLMQGAQTKKNYRNFLLHVEFMLSFMPFDRGQARSNSGIFLDGRYEVQVLDSFGLPGRADDCASIYSLRAPDVNMCYPPLTWQTYDIDFRAPVYDASGKKTHNAVVTVKWNGVVVQDHQEVPQSTFGAQEGPELGPIVCMNHGDPLLFRNIWVLPRE